MADTIDCDCGARFYAVLADGESPEERRFKAVMAEMTGMLGSLMKTQFKLEAMKLLLQSKSFDPFDFSLSVTDGEWRTRCRGRVEQIERLAEVAEAIAEAHCK